MDAKMDSVVKMIKELKVKMSEFDIKTKMMIKESLREKLGCFMQEFK